MEMSIKNNSKENQYTILENEENSLVKKIKLTEDSKLDVSK